MGPQTQSRYETTTSLLDAAFRGPPPKNPADAGAQTIAIANLFDQVVRDLPGIQNELSRTYFRMGTYVGEEYLLVNVIGYGGMGIACLGFTRDNKTAVTVKFPWPYESRWSEKKRDQYENGARIQAEIHSPYLPRFIGSGDHLGWPFMVTEYLAGRDFRHIIASARRPLDVSFALSIAADVCSGLSDMHAQGVIHRDIKPHNILLTPYAEIKLLDFELSRRDTPVESDTLLSGAGTAIYMSPEQAHGKGAGPTSDIYALGATLFVFVTGQLPFPGETGPAQYRFKLQDDPRPFSILTFNRELPGALDALLNKAMAPDPAARFQSAAEMKLAISDLQLELSAK